MLHQKGSIIGALLLVAGTCIGGGMLALPVATGLAGFFPSLFMMLLGWAFMTLTALFLLEVNLLMKDKDAHIITIASKLLGPVGKVAAWILYLFIGYASLVAYTAGGGDLLQSGIQGILGIELTQKVCALIFVALFGFIVYLGNVIVGRVNTILVVGLVLSYIVLISSGASHVVWDNLLHSNWGTTLIAVPLLLTIFSFQTIVPSLTIYLKRDGRALRIAIVGGSLLALMVYALWQWLVLGTVLVDGDDGLAAALAQGRPTTEFLKVAIGGSWVATFAEFFAFFALVTSFLGISLGLFDFLSDGLKIKKKGWGNVGLGLLVAVPTLFFTFSLERVFLLALDVSGGIGDSILNGIMPALMVWVGRYVQKIPSEWSVFGGRPLILFAIAYGLFVLIIELLGRFGLILSIA